jgi:hypothetical protein
VISYGFLKVALSCLLTATVIVPAIAGEEGIKLTVVNAQGQDSDGKPVLEDKDPLLQDAQEYASDTGVNIDEALSRFQLQDIAGAHCQEITDYFFQELELSQVQIVSLSCPVAFAVPRILPFSDTSASVLSISSSGVSSLKNIVPLVSLK